MPRPAASRPGSSPLATKVCNTMGAGPNQRGLSRKWMTEALDGSLRRLGTDYLDIYYLHREDPSRRHDFEGYVLLAEDHRMFCHGDCRSLVAQVGLPSSHQDRSATRGRLFGALAAPKRMKVELQWIIAV